MTDEFMPEMHLKQAGFTYIACGLFTKNKERIKKNRETGDSRYIYQNELDKACFQHNMAYGDFKDLNRRTPADKVLRGKAFNIAKNPKYNGYQRGFISMVYKFVDKKASDGAIKNEIMSNKELAEELRKPIIIKFEKRKLHSSFIYNIWSADLADMQLISKLNRGFRFLLYVLDSYSKYAWVIPLKDKKGSTNTNAFRNMLDKSKRKPSKIWVDKGSEFCNRSVKSFLQNSDIEMYPTYNEEKYFIA